MIVDKRIKKDLRGAKNNIRRKKISKGKPKARLKRHRKSRRK